MLASSAALGERWANLTPCDQEKLQAVEAGADDFVTKPCNSILLLTRVNSLLRINLLHDEVDQGERLADGVLERAAVVEQRRREQRIVIESQTGWNGHRSAFSAARLRRVSRQRQRL